MKEHKYRWVGGINTTRPNMINGFSTRATAMGPKLYEQPLWTFAPSHVDVPGKYDDFDFVIDFSHSLTLPGGSTQVALSGFIDFTDYPIILNEGWSLDFGTESGEKMELITSALWLTKFGTGTKAGCAECVNWYVSLNVKSLVSKMSLHIKWKALEQGLWDVPFQFYFFGFIGSSKLIKHSLMDLKDEDLDFEWLYGYLTDD